MDPPEQNGLDELLAATVVIRTLNGCKQQKRSSAGLREERELIGSSEPRLASGMGASRAPRVLLEPNLSAILHQFSLFSSFLFCFVFKEGWEKGSCIVSLSLCDDHTAPAAPGLHPTCFKSSGK